jgi:GNAT superfamily N-acetyltransferase
MSPYRIRQATTKDLRALAEQRRSMFLDMHAPSKKALAVHDRAFPRWARREMLAKRLYCFLAEDEHGEIVGGGSVWLREVQPFPGFKGGRVPYLMSMYTRPNLRGKGVATAIVQRAISWCRSRGYDSMTLHASRMGRPLYEKLGWEDSSEMELDFEKVRKRSSRAARQPSRHSGR